MRRTCQKMRGRRLFARLILTMRMRFCNLRAAKKAGAWMNAPAKDLLYFSMNSTPSVPGPQWLETVQPARVMQTSSKG